MIKSGTKTVIFGLGALALCFSAQAQRGRSAPEERGSRSREVRSTPERSGREATPTRSTRAPRADLNEFRLDAPLPEDDLDYKSFYRRITKDKFKATRKETFKDRRKIPFEFEKFDYPTGEENPRSYRFDMGPADGPLKEGWNRITKDDSFSWERGFGWTPEAAADDFHYADPSSQSFQKVMDYVVVTDTRRREAFAKKHRPLGIRGARISPSQFEDFFESYLNPMSRDAVLNPDQLAFKVALPKGKYTVTMIVGDMQIPRFGMDVYANGYLVASNIETTVFQHRGITEPWPTRITFPVNVDRNFLRLSLRANDNMFEERCDVIVETPDYVQSQLPFVLGSGQIRMAPYFGKPMNMQGPPTQMAISGIIIAPYEEPSLSLIRQKLFARPSLDSKPALEGVEKFNNGDYTGAEASFAHIPDTQPLLKALAYMSLVGIFETPLSEEQRLMEIAISVLEKGCHTDPEDFVLSDQLQIARFYLDALDMIDNAEALGLKVRSTAASLMGWTQPTDILYSKTLAHRGRCFQTFDPHRWGAWQWAEEEFTKLENRDPGNRYSGYYLRGDLTGWGVKDYTAGAEGAPRWAILIREAYNRLLDQAEWWGQNRQQPDGRLGGGWGDDVEIGIVWESLMLVNPDASPIAMETTRAIAEGVWWSGDIDRDVGYFDGIADVEHSSEWTADSQAIMMGIDYGNPTYFERSLKTGELMRDLWMDKNDRGHLHFKSITLGNRAVGKTSGWAIKAQLDHPLNGRAAFPATWAWWYSPVDGLDQLFSEWAEAWLEDSEREENGKPAGVIPGPIGFPSGTLGGNQATEWRRGAPKTNSYENPTYTNYITALFSHMYKKTGDPKWLKPKTVRVTPAEVFEDVLSSVADPTAETRIEDKDKHINKEADLETILQIIRMTWPSVTSEIAATDRIAVPGLMQILRLLTGGISSGGMDFIPATFERTSRDISFMNLVSSPREVKSIFYSFADGPEDVHMRLWNLKVMARHSVRIGVDTNDDDEIDETIKTFDYEHLHRGDTVDFTIEAKKTVVVEINRTEDGPRVQERVVDLALASEDIEYKDGQLSITIHNIGNLDCEPFSFNVWHGKPENGTLLKSFEVDALEAPNDLKPRRVTRTLDWTLPDQASLQNPATITVVVDPDDAHYEITERNNVIARVFPYETKAYMVPRMWPTLAAKYGRKRGDPFPEDFPENQKR